MSVQRVTYMNLTCVLGGIKNSEMNVDESIAQVVREMERTILYILSLQFFQ